MATRRISVKGWTTRPDGVRLAHQVHGPRSAPVLLLLQGQANNHHWWDRLRGYFSQRWLTVTFDYRGTGSSVGVGDEAAWSTRGFADDAAAVLASLGRDEALVYGTSMGGRVAQELAINYSGLVRRLALACTTSGGEHAVERSREVRRMLAEPDRAQLHRNVVDLFYTPRWVNAHGGYAQVVTDLLGDPHIGRHNANRHLKVSGGHDAWDRLDQIQAPTLLVYGTDDLMVPVDNAAILAARIPRASVEIVQGGRHGFFDEYRRSVSPLVGSFLATGATRETATTAPSQQASVAAQG